MNPKEMSDEELVLECLSWIIRLDRKSIESELSARLARGRKAIETLKTIQEIAYNYAKNIHTGGDIAYIIDDFFKEATDD